MRLLRSPFANPGGVSFIYPEGRNTFREAFDVPTISTHSSALEIESAFSRPRSIKDCVT